MNELHFVEDSSRVCSPTSFSTADIYGKVSLWNLGSSITGLLIRYNCKSSNVDLKIDSESLSKMIPIKHSTSSTTVYHHEF